MPLQNRVTPFGKIISDPARGSLMGNRGCLHRQGQIMRSWAVKRWICCVLDFKGRHREPMPEGRYTSLFFLDEAVAMAAGHRPCAECRRTDYMAFQQAWTRAYGAQASANAMDQVIHAARLDQAVRPAPTVLPEGAMLAHGSQAYLWSKGRILPYHPNGYLPAIDPPKDLRLLTPEPLLKVLEQGYQPNVFRA
jgi:hypothetical protein